MTDETEAAASAAENIIDDEREDDFRGVYSLMCAEPGGTIALGALIQALKGTGMVEESRARAIAETAAAGRDPDLAAFRQAIVGAVEEAGRRALERSTLKGSGSSVAQPTLGAALLGVLEDLRKYAQSVEDFRLAHHSKEMFVSLTSREEVRRLQHISERQAQAQAGVQEAHMMQAMEFNSAWSQNMTEFERQAREIEDQCRQKHAEEFAEFQTKLQAKASRTYKFSRELLLMRKSVDTLAKQGRYNEAHKLKAKAQKLEEWERMKLDNEQEMTLAAKELQLKQQQQMQLEALQRRIARGREEHKEHWLQGAQRLMQSHKNMLSDLKTKQALENTRAEVAVKLDIAASRATAAKERSRTHFADTGPRVDCGPRRKKVGA